MRLDELQQMFAAFEGALVWTPDEDSGAPEIAWGDTFVYFVPDGRIPETAQPYATVVVKDYPGDIASRLSGADRWRVNIHVDSGTFRELVGDDPRGVVAERDFAESDVVLPHLVYGSAGWIAVVNPGARTTGTIERLARAAHDAAAARSRRRAGGGAGGGISS